MVGRLSWMRVIGVATGFSLVVGLSVLPGTEAMAAAEESSPSPSLLLDPDRPAPALETPDFEVPATEFPEGEFDAAAPVAAAEPVKIRRFHSWMLLTSRACRWWRRTSSPRRTTAGTVCWLR